MTKLAFWRNRSTLFNIIAGLSALILQIILLPFIIKLSHKKHWYDPRDPRKIHTGDIPRTGGIGIFIALVVPVIFAQLICISPVKNYSFIVTGLSILFLTGILDDFENLRARYKLTLQIIAAIVVIAAGFRFPSFRLPFGITIHNSFITYGITFFWIVGVTNSMNLIDGMDGLAGGITCIAALFWGFIALCTGHAMETLFAFTLAGAALGFLVFNLPPARIFMGDSGSLILGYSLALLPLIGNRKEDAADEFLIIVTLLVIPIFDTFAAVFRRIRLKRSIAEPDKDHLHHKFLKLGCSPKKTLLIIYSFCIFSGAAALVWTLVPGLNIFLLPLTWLPALILFWYLHTRYWKL